MIITVIVLSRHICACVPKKTEKDKRAFHNSATNQDGTTVNIVVNNVVLVTTINNLRHTHTALQAYRRKRLYQRSNFWYTISICIQYNLRYDGDREKGGRGKVIYMYIHVHV